MNNTYRTWMVSALIVAALAGVVPGAAALDLLPHVVIDTEETTLVWTIDAGGGARTTVGAGIGAPRLVREARRVPLLPRGNAVVLHVNDWVATGPASSGVGVRPPAPPEQTAPVTPWWTFDAGTHFAVTGATAAELLYGVVRWAEAPAEARLAAGNFEISGTGRSVVRRDGRTLTIAVASGRFVVRRSGAVLAILGRSERSEFDLGDAPVRDAFANAETAMFAELDPAISRLLSGQALQPEEKARVRSTALAFAALYAEAEERRFPWVEAPDLLANHIAEALWIQAFVPRGR